MEAASAVLALAALAQEHRLQIFRLLVDAGRDGMAAGEICDRIGVPASSLSFHLNQLKNAQLIVCTRQSRSLIYSANFEKVRMLLLYITEECCGGSPELCFAITSKTGQLT